MTEKQKRFCDEYIKSGGNAARAARNAGYSAKSARQIGSENLTKLDISEALSARVGSQGEVEEALAKIKSIMRGEETETIVTPSGQCRTVPARVAERLRASELILKLSGAFSEKVDVKVDATRLFIQTLEEVWADENPSD